MKQLETEKYISWTDHLSPMCVLALCSADHLSPMCVLALCSADHLSPMCVLVLCSADHLSPMCVLVLCSADQLSPMCVLVLCSADHLSPMCVLVLCSADHLSPTLGLCSADHLSPMCLSTVFSLWFSLVMSGKWIKRLNCAPTEFTSSWQSGYHWYPTLPTDVCVSRIFLFFPLHLLHLSWYVSLPWIHWISWNLAALKN